MNSIHFICRAMNNFLPSLYKVFKVDFYMNVFITVILHRNIIIKYFVYNYFNFISISFGDRLDKLCFFVHPG